MEADAAAIDPRLERLLALRRGTEITHSKFTLRSFGRVGSVALTVK
jgi:hypothetical protein